MIIDYGHTQNVGKAMIVYESSRKAENPPQVTIE